MPNKPNIGINSYHLWFSKQQLYDKIKNGYNTKIYRLKDDSVVDATEANADKQTWHGYDDYIYLGEGKYVGTRNYQLQQRELN